MALTRFLLAAIPLFSKSHKCLCYEQSAKLVFVHRDQNHVCWSPEDFVLSGLMFNDCHRDAESSPIVSSTVNLYVHKSFQYSTFFHKIISCLLCV